MNIAKKTSATSLIGAIEKLFFTNTSFDASKHAAHMMKSITKFLTISQHGIGSSVQYVELGMCERKIINDVINSNVLYKTICVRESFCMACDKDHLNRARCTSGIMINAITAINTRSVIEP